MNYPPPPILDYDFMINWFKGIYLQIKNRNKFLKIITSMDFLQFYMASGTYITYTSLAISWLFGYINNINIF